MKKVYYKKLVRDKIVEKIKNLGEETEVRELSDEEFAQELLKKVNEEAGALSRVRSREEFLDELADLLVVLDTLVSVHGISEDDLASSKQKNIDKKGLYTKKLFMHWSEDKTYKSNETPQGISS